MKAKVIATGEIVDVYCDNDMWVDKHSEVVYCPWEIDINYDEVKPYTPDYWTRLEHQYAGMAMQGFLAGGMKKAYEFIAKFSINQAHALVEKLKEESK